MITRADVDDAAARIAGHVRVTPVVEVEAGAVWFKLELLQHTGTFKARRIVVEHGAAAAFAALASGAYAPERGARVAILLCGANTDPSDL